MSDNAGEPPLKGIRVLDLSRVLAGPFCSMTLSDLGAEVIKVEIPGRGDDTRAYPPFVNGESSYFMSINRGKKSVTLNLKTEEARKALYRIAEKCDVELRFGETHLPQFDVPGGGKSVDSAAQTTTRMLPGADSSGGSHFRMRSM